MRRRSLPWYHRIQAWTWALLVLLLLVSASVAFRVAHDAKVQRRPPKVQVVNGSGVPELAQRAARHLRERGLDVRDIGNADADTYGRTLVLLRRGDPAVARRVAQALGSATVLEQRDPTLLVDVTVVLGRDFAPRP